MELSGKELRARGLEAPLIVQWFVLPMFLLAFPLGWAIERYQGYTFKQTLDGWNKARKMRN